MIFLIFFLWTQRNKKKKANARKILWTQLQIQHLKVCHLVALAAIQEYVSHYYDCVGYQPTSI